MKTSLLKAVILGVSSLLMVSVSYAKCYPGLDCEVDLPTSQQHPVEKGWLIVERYLVKDGLVKDPDTHLMWMRCSLGQTWDGSTCQNAAEEYTWDTAMEKAKHLDYAGYSDWRIPTTEELKTLVYCNKGRVIVNQQSSTECDGEYISPVIIQAAFPNTPISWFWTSSEYKDSKNDKEDYVWEVSFYYGASNQKRKHEKSAVRLVRNAH